MKKNIIFFILVLFFSACASGSGVYHKVKRGENLYRISKSYGISPKQLARANRIKNPAKVKAGQKLWIPGASKVVAVKKGPSGKNKVRSANTKKWKKKNRTYPDVKVAFSWPLSGKVVTTFGTVDGEIHDGIDIAARLGTPVKAAADGKVIYSGGEIKSYGNMVIVKHAGAYSTIYAQNKSNAVKKGQVVKAGELIAYVGNSRRSNRPLLHFEIRKGKDALDPQKYLSK
ncbi:MAG: peptidoglycan DD-metalloendopeptidase family protein [Proteobacteria bacterium]|nr:peptidoglycan DD-metalloendopeptidase family protein [Pseudomonadota bacterium]